MISSFCYYCYDKELAMTDETVTPSVSEPEESKPAAPAEAAPAPAPAPKPAKPVIPSPKAFAGKTQQQSAVATYNEADLEAAMKFGRVTDDSTVFVKEGDEEHKVGQMAQEEPDKALRFFARRYLDLKAKFDRFAKRLEGSHIRSREIDSTLNELEEDIKKADVVGDIAALKSRLEELKTEGASKKEELAAARKEAMAKAAAEREKIVVEAEQLAASLGDSTNWRQTGDKFQALFNKWQEHQKHSIHLEKSQADALWKRFSAARSSFNSARRAWIQQRDSQRSEARKAKEKIIAAAESIQDSTDWAATSRRFNELMDEWKAAGRVGRHEEDDALWKRFRAAADVFFNARQADRDKLNEGETENLKKKEALLEKAKALLPVKDVKEAKQTRQSLAKIQDEWDQIGYVPRADVHRLESALDDVDKQIKAVEETQWTNSDPETDARKSDFELQLNAQLEELDRKIASETDPAKKQELKAEKAAKEAWLKAIK